MDKKSSSLFSGLFGAYQEIGSSLEKNLRESGQIHLTRTQIIILISIINGLSRGSQLAKAMGISRQAVQQQLDELIESNILTKKPDSGDKRANKIVFTHNGKQVANLIQTASAQIEKDLSDTVGQENFRVLLKLLALNWNKATKLDPIEQVVIPKFNSEATK